MVEASKFEIKSLGVEEAEKIEFTFNLTQREIKVLEKTWNYVPEKEDDLVEAMSKLDIKSDEKSEFTGSQSKPKKLDIWPMFRNESEIFRLLLVFLSEETDYNYWSLVAQFDKYSTVKRLEATLKNLG